MSCVKCIRLQLYLDNIEKQIVQGDKSLLNEWGNIRSRLDTECTSECTSKNCITCYVNSKIIKDRSSSDIVNAINICKGCKCSDCNDDMNLIVEEYIAQLVKKMPVSLKKHK